MKIIKLFVYLYVFVCMCVVYWRVWHQDCTRWLDVKSLYYRVENSESVCGCRREGFCFLIFEVFGFTVNMLCSLSVGVN